MGSSIAKSLKRIMFLSAESYSVFETKWHPTWRQQKIARITFRVREALFMTRAQMYVASWIKSTAEEFTKRCVLTFRQRFHNALRRRHWLPLVLMWQSLKKMRLSISATNVSSCCKFIVNVLSHLIAHSWCLVQQHHTKLNVVDGTWHKIEIYF